MSASLEIRDPVHGFIHRQDHERKIIDTKLFQRLRRIKQLALASLVYPGALHTRFEHSIGAMHVAARIVKKLESHLDEHEQRILRLAALLHDIGHGPFSHVSEDVLRGVTGKKQAHEELTSQIILTNPELTGPLSGDEREEVVGLLKGSRGDTLMTSLLSGPLDVDKQDYLLRDSYFCGVKYGIYDFDRLIETLRVCEDKGNRYLAISEDGVLTLEQFVIARYHMNGQVYRHRVRSITDSMIVRGIELGIEIDDLKWLRELYSYDGSEVFLQNYLEWDDERLVKNVLYGNHKHGYAHQMFERLANRQLLKELVHLDTSDLDPVSSSMLLQDDPLKRKELEREVEKIVADHLPEIDTRLIIAKILRPKSAGQTEASILVMGDGGSPMQFREVSTLFRSIDPAIQETYLDVYGPVTWADPHQKKNRQESCKREIVPAINEYLKSRAISSKRISPAGVSSGGESNGS